MTEAELLMQWFVLHEGAVKDATAAVDALNDAVVACGPSPDNEAIRRLQEAAGEVATVAAQSLQAPDAGVDAFDQPWREGLELYQRATQTLSTCDPRTDTATAQHALELFTRATTSTGAAMDYGRRLAPSVFGVGWN